MWRKRNTSTLLVELSIGATTVESSMEIPQKTKNRTIIRPAIPLLGIYPQNTMAQKDTCTPMFIAVLFAIATTWKQPKCPSTEEWIKTMWYMYTIEHYSAIKRKEIMEFAATWMDL